VVTGTPLTVVYLGSTTVSFYYFAYGMVSRGSTGIAASC
jgi:hypothetical protein